MELGTDKLRSLFMLDPDITYLNHGSFGACPKPIFASLLRWQKRLEREPVKSLAYDLYDNLEKSREALSLYVNCHKDDIVFFPNPSTALNTVLRSLDLKEGDEVLTTNHEYGAMDKAWRFLSKKQGFSYKNQNITIPLVSKAQFIYEFKKGITNKTKVIFISHITSPTALIFPVEDICRIAKERGIITIIDGAHAPAQIDLDISKFKPDFYSGACHKWMCSPKGVAFLYVSKHLQDKIEPLVISWGYDSERPSHSQYLDYLQWQGTDDMSSYLTIPDTINFLQENNWREVTEECHKLNLWARDKIVNELNLESLSNDLFVGQMSSFYYQLEDVFNDQRNFYEKYKIQIPFFSWNNKTLLRVSLQAYNRQDDVNQLIVALKDFR